jgi:hypothetical protein
MKKKMISLFSFCSLIVCLFVVKLSLFCPKYDFNKSFNCVNRICPFVYTGLTRAKQSLVLLGEQEAFDIGLKTNGQIRLTQLNDLLKSYFGLLFTKQNK